MSKIEDFRFKYLVSRSEYWEQENPVLMQGELGIEQDTWRIKVGDSLQSWKSLPYINLHPGNASEVNEDIASDNLYVTVEELSELQDLSINSMWETIAVDLDRGYIGYLNNKTWKIKKKTGTYPNITREYASNDNNPGYVKFDNAWNARGDLVYET